MDGNHLANQIESMPGSTVQQANQTTILGARTTSCPGSRSEQEAAQHIPLGSRGCPQRWMFPFRHPELVEGSVQWKKVPVSVFVFLPLNI